MTHFSKVLKQESLKLLTSDLLKKIEKPPEDGFSRTS